MSSFYPVCLFRCGRVAGPSAPTRSSVTLITEASRRPLTSESFRTRMAERVSVPRPQFTSPWEVSRSPRGLNPTVPLGKPGVGGLCRGIFGKTFRFRTEEEGSSKVLSARRRDLLKLPTPSPRATNPMCDPFPTTNSDRGTSSRIPSGRSDRLLHRSLPASD